MNVIDCLSETSCNDFRQVHRKPIQIVATLACLSLLLWCRYDADTLSWQHKSLAYII